MLTRHSSSMLAVFVAAFLAGKSDGVEPPRTAESRSTPDESNPIRITFKDIDLGRLLKPKAIAPEHVEQIPAPVTALDGTFVTIQGVMSPTFHAKGLTGFVLIEGYL